MYIRKIFISFFFFLFIFHTHAQEDTRHYIPPMFSRIQPGVHYLFLSTSKVDSFKVRIYNGQRLHDTLYISRHKPAVLELGQRYDAIGMINATKLNKVLYDEGVFLCGNYPFQARIVHEAREEPNLFGAPGNDTTRYLVDDIYKLVNQQQIEFNNVKTKEDSVYFDDLKNGIFFGKGSMTSKGTAVLGKRFRVGTYLTNINYSPRNGKESPNTVNNDKLKRTILSTETNPHTVRPSQFISIMATEDSTMITIDEIPTSTKFHKVPYSQISDKSKKVQKMLHHGQSYVLGLYPDQMEYYVDNFGRNDYNFMIGTLITATKPIAVSSGAFFAKNESGGFGFDQLIPSHSIGRKYLVRESKTSAEEYAIVVATEDKTKVSINGYKAFGGKMKKGEFRLFNNFHVPSGYMQIEADKDIYVFLVSGQLYADHFQSISPARNCDVNNMIYISHMDYAMDESVYENTLVRDSTIIESAGPKLYLYGAEKTLVEVFDGQTDELITSTVLAPKNISQYGLSYYSDKVKLPKGLKHIYLKGNKSFTSSLFNSYSATPYHSGFSNSPIIHVDTDSCTCKGISLCPYDSVPLFIETFEKIDSIRWYKNDSLLPQTDQSRLWANGPGTYTVKGINSCSSCPKRFKEVENTLVVSVSENCYYNEVDTLETIEKIALDMKGLDIDVIDSSIFVPLTFEFATAVVNYKDLTILDKVAAYMLADTSMHIKLVAHTDCRGQEQYNLKLSQKRAKYVYNHIIAQGVAENRLSYIGVGESQPFYTNCECLSCTEDELAKNRRLEFIIQK